MEALKAFLKQYYSMILAAILFLSHQFVEPFKSHSLVDSYLDDLLFFPVVLGLLVFLFRLFLGGRFQLSYFMILSAWALTFFSTEFLFPRLSNQHVGDPLDGLAYFIGAVIFHLTSNRLRQPKGN